MDGLDQAGVARSHMMYDANRKSAGISYLLLIFLGGFGIHRFYLGRIFSGVVQLLLNIVGWLTLLVGIGLVFFGALFLWLMIDLFLIPGMVRRQNMRLAHQLTGGMPILE